MNRQDKYITCLITHRGSLKLKIWTPVSSHGAQRKPHKEVDICLKTQRSERINTQISTVKTFQTEETSIVLEEKVLLVSPRTRRECSWNKVDKKGWGTEMRKGEGQITKGHC